MRNWRSRSQTSVRRSIIYFRSSSSQPVPLSCWYSASAFLGYPCRCCCPGPLLRQEEKKSREKFSFELFQLIHQFYSLLSFYFFFFFFSGERGQLTSFLPCPFFYLLLPSSPSVHTDSRTFLFFCPPFHCLPKWSEEWACKEPATQHSS